MSYARPLLAALGTTPVPSDAPTPGQPQPPIWPLQIGSHGAWLEIRSSPTDGSCGVSGYPCKHPGIDVAGPSGTPVVAPETGVISLVGDGNTAPFVGYGPWFVVIQGDSGKYHLLAHLDPVGAAMAPIGSPVTAGQVVGTTSSANHTHWEVRDQAVPDYAGGQDNFTNNSDPLAWLAGAALGTGAFLVAGAASILIWLLLRRRS
jgi:murein DD-endopeptidase MepM/ murein hydrolase activator NlpD